jgi:hypothetical protein
MYLKEKVLDEHSVNIKAGIAAKGHRVWDECDYRVDVCHATQGGHIEGLYLTHENLDSSCCGQCVFSCKVRNKLFVNFETAPFFCACPVFCK